MLGSCHEISSRHRQGTNTKYFPPPPRFLYVMSAQFTPPFNIPRFVHITKVPDLKNRRNLRFHWMNPKPRRVGANERPPPHWRARGASFPLPVGSFHADHAHASVLGSRCHCGGPVLCTSNGLPFDFTLDTSSSSTATCFMRLSQGVADQNRR